MRKGNEREKKKKKRGREETRCEEVVEERSWNWETGKETQLRVMQAAPVTYKNTWRGSVYWREQDGAVQEWQQKMTR